MAHFAKYNRQQILQGTLVEHCGRKEDDGHKHSNQSIEQKRTHLNYNLAETDQPLPMRDFIKQRISEVKCLKRDDVVLAGSWLVTRPQNVTDEQTEEFFRATYDFLCNRYGKENVIGAWVHMDETTPHMHFSFVPVIEDTDKKGRIVKKVNCKKLINRQEMQTFHTDLQAYLTETLGYAPEILNGATGNGNKTVQELKNQKLEQENTQLLEENQRLQQANDELNHENADLSEQLQATEKELQETRDKLKEVQDTALRYQPRKKKPFESASAYQESIQRANQAQAIIDREESVSGRENAVTVRERDVKVQGDKVKSDKAEISLISDKAYRKGYQQAKRDAEDELKKLIEQAVKEQTKLLNEQIAQLKGQNDWYEKDNDYLRKALEELAGLSESAVDSVLDKYYDEEKLNQANQNRTISTKW